MTHSTSPSEISAAPGAPPEPLRPSLFEDLWRVSGVWLALLLVLLGLLWWLGRSGSRIISELAYTSPNAYQVALVYRAEGRHHWRLCLERVNARRGEQKRLESALGLLKGDAALETARASLLRALEFYPDFVDVPEMLGDLALWSGDSAESYRWLGEAAAARAREATLAGRRDAAREEWEVALMNFTIAVQQNDASPRSLEGRIEALLRLDRPGEARAILEETAAPRDQPVSVRRLRLEAEIRGRLGETEQKEALLRQAFELDPTDLEVIRALGDFLTFSGRKTDAYDFYARALEHVSNDANLFHRRALLAVELNQLEEAVRLYREAVALLPNNAALQYQLGQTYLKLGDPRRATPYLRRAVELDPARFREAP